MKKKLISRFLVLIVTMGFGKTAFSAKAPETPPKTLFSRPLIVGASISAEYFAPSPGRLLAEKWVKKPDVNVIAKGGASAVRINQRLSRANFKDRTVVVAVDYLFWDSVAAKSQAGVTSSIKALQNLIDLSTAKKIPLVIGDVPDLMAGVQPARAELNRELLSRCGVKDQCYILGLNVLYQEVKKRGYLALKDRQLSVAEVLPDGLHISREASGELANRIETLITGKSSRDS